MRTSKLYKSVAAWLSQTKLILPAVAALLLASQASAQVVVLSMDFEGETPYNASPMGENAGAKLHPSSNSSLYEKGWRGYYNYAAGNTDHGYTPHVTSTTSNAYYNPASSSTRSLSFAGRQGHLKYPSPGILLLPELEYPISSLHIKFWLRTNTSTSSDVQFKVGYVTGTNYTYGSLGRDVMAGFVPLGTLSASSQSASSAGVWVELDLTDAPSNATRIAIQYICPLSGARYASIDDLEVTLLASCLPVSNLSATADYTSATVTWTDNNEATQWRVTVDDGAAQTVSSTSYTLTGLTPGTEHTVSVVSVCDEDDSQPASITFTTTSCPSVSDLRADADYTSASIFWTETGSATQWQVALDGGSPVTVTSPTRAFTGLAPNTDHTATVRGICATGVYSDWASVDFRTACPMPTELAIQSIVEESVTLQWYGTASQYEVQLSTEPDFSTITRTATVSTGSVYFTDLTVGTLYYARVRAHCGSDPSEWSAVLTVYLADFSSAPASGLYAETGTVVLNDMEPHDWSIYTTAVDKPLRSLNPADVRIVYRGYGTNNMSSNVTFNSDLSSTSAYVPVVPSEFTVSTTAADVSVGISQEERRYHTFEYFKTLERVDGKTAETQATGRLEYQTIFNPFSRRPAYNAANYDWATMSSDNGAPCFRGFYKWRLDRVVGGTVYTAPTGGSPLAVGAFVRADQKLYFDPAGESGMEVEFTALWAPAAVRYWSASNMPSVAYGADSRRDSVGTERNFLVLDGRVTLAGPLQGQEKPKVGIESADRAVTLTSVFPNGTLDGVEPAYGPVKEERTTARVTRTATYIDHAYNGDLLYNRLVTPRSDLRFEYLAMSRLRGTRNAFNLDGSLAAWWGSISAGQRNLTLGRGLETMFDDNKGIFNYIVGVIPYNYYGSNTDKLFGSRRSDDNYQMNASGNLLKQGVDNGIASVNGDNYPKPNNNTGIKIDNNFDYTIRIESGYVGCVMTIYGWNANYQDQEGNDITTSSGGSQGTVAVNYNGTDNYARFVMGNDFDRADEAQQVRDLGTDYAARGYQTLDSMLYNEIYKYAKTKIYRPFRVSSFAGYLHNQHKDSVYSDMILKSGFVGQEIIDREIGHEEGGTGSGKRWGRKVIDGIVREGSKLHWSPKSIYNVSSNNNNHRGKRRMLIEGGFLNCCVSAGAWDRTNDVTRWRRDKSAASGIAWNPYYDAPATNNDVSTIRMKGGIITGSMFGGGNTYTASGGGRQLILTGGAVRAWIAGGVNGTDPQPQQWEGIHYGNAWIYVGGNMHVGSGDTSHTTVGDTCLPFNTYSGINGSKDGCVFGAGCGIRPIYLRADSTEVEHQWNMNAYKYNRMGRVDSSFVYIADQAEVEGDVYGGGNYGYNNPGTPEEDRWDKQDRMGGLGTPASPTSLNDTTKSSRSVGKATMRILGGTVGGRLFGGANNKFGREVDIRMTDGHIKGGIFGGSNTWGYITKDIDINLLGGTVGTPETPAIICGGGLGKETAVFGNVTINIGAAGTAGPTLHADVYGGSQQGTTNAGGYRRDTIGWYNPSNNVNKYAVGHLYIDTAAAQGYGYNTEKKTLLNIYSGTVDGNVFGGGFGPDNLFASTYGDITVNLLGGEVTKNVYGCNDASGKPMGKVRVNIGSPTSDPDAPHPVVRGSVYGGGRDASYGVAPDNYTPVVEMLSGRVDKNVFGGGEGNTAVISLPDEDYATKVLIRFGSIYGSVYGGGNDAKVVGNTHVVIGDEGGAIVITAQSANASQGSVSGGGTYPLDRDVELVATPAPGYSFKQWQDGSTHNPRTISVKENATYTAEFEPTPSYAITATANNGSLGTVSGGGSYAPGTTVALTASPNEGVKFVQWSDGVTYNPRYVKVTGPATYTAEFVQRQQYTLTLVASPSSAGSVSQSGDGTYYEGDLISISATPNDGYLLRRWNDNETASPRTIALSTNSTYTAYFEAIPIWQLTVSVNNAAWGTVSQSAASVLETESATISATPNEGYRFIGWNDGVSTNPRTVRLTQNTTFTAMFEAIPTYTVNLASNNNAYGTVSGAGTYYENTTVTITATPRPGYKFVQWSDGSTQRMRTFTATENVNLTATFEEFSMEWVDLGLPSQTKWANCNVGATSLEDVGDYYAWGETAPKTSYTWGTYAHGSGQYALTKYNYNSGYGILDDRRELEPADDAAYQALGGGAHIPSPTQYAELFNTSYVTISYNTTENGVAGVRITSRANGNSIFIPYGGYMNATTKTNSNNLLTWTNTLGTNVPYYGQHRYVSNSSTSPTTTNRYYGMPIRAAYNTPYQITATSDNTSMGTVSGGGTYYNGATVILTATPNPNHTFVQWNDGNTSNPRTVTVAGNATYTAQFRARTVATIPYSTGFEDNAENAEWQFFNGTFANKWNIGTAYNGSTPAFKGGSKSLYISNNNGTSNNYTISTASYVYAYRDVTFTAGSHTISFDWKGYGESTYDFLCVYLCPANSAIPPSTYPNYNSSPTDWQKLMSADQKLNLTTAWNTYTYTFNVATAGTYYLVFFWRNDGSGGSQPPIAVDNVGIVKGNATLPLIAQPND